ncbi:MAG: GIY-YIG nuclease family protein [Ignavibacteriaceae bacterium]|jgi:putative endonuclease|nr:GIY-YIG nuclease family protein [Ignavibacteriaceae bacterium]
MFHVYILRSEKDEKRYVGFTTNLERRLSEHQTGCVTSTKNYRPLQLIHSEEFFNKLETEQREKFFKSGKGRTQLKEMGL